MCYNKIRIMIVNELLILRRRNIMLLELGKYFKTVCRACESDGCTVEVENISFLEGSSENEVKLKLTIRCYICMALEEKVITIPKK
jgi:hypothetical protein